MDGALVFTWGTPVRGREAKSLEVFGKALAFYEGLAKKGRIHGHREYLSLTGNSSKWGGMMVIDGELSELQKIMTEDESLRLQIEAAGIVDHFTTQIAVGGSDQSIGEQMGRYADSMKGLGYM